MPESLTADGLIAVILDSAKARGLSVPALAAASGVPRSVAYRTLTGVDTRSGADAASLGAVLRLAAAAGIRVTARPGKPAGKTKPGIGTESD